MSSDELWALGLSSEKLPRYTTKCMDYFPSYAIGATEAGTCLRDWEACCADMIWCATAVVCNASSGVEWDYAYMLSYL